MGAEGDDMMVVDQPNEDNMVVDQPSERPEKWQGLLSSDPVIGNDSLLENISERLMICKEEALNLILAVYKIPDKENRDNTFDDLLMDIWSKSPADRSLKHWILNKMDERFAQASCEASPLWKAKAVQEEPHIAEYVATPKMELLHRKKMKKYKLMYNEKVANFWRRSVIQGQKFERCFCPRKPLVEVFQLIIYPQAATIDLYGKIKFNNVHHVYHREIDSCESFYLKPKFASLIDPSAGISWHYEYGVRIFVELTDKHSGDTIQQEQTVEPYDPKTFSLENPPADRVMSLDFRAEYFSATLKLAFMPSALTAIVQVRLICKGTDENADPIDANVHGEIFASIGAFNQSTERKRSRDDATMYLEESRGNTTTLFNLSEIACTPVKPYEVIPLSRSLIAVPFSSPLKVYAKLMNLGKGQILRGFAEFFPADIKRQCTLNRYISGKHAEIQVRVDFY